MYPTAEIGPGVPLIGLGIAVAPVDDDVAEHVGSELPGSEVYYARVVVVHAPHNVVCSINLAVSVEVTGEAEGTGVQRRCAAEVARE